jgi:hypothetical protein
MSPIISRIASSGTSNPSKGFSSRMRAKFKSKPFDIDFLVAAGGAGGVNSIGGGGGGAGGYLSSISGELSGGNSSPLLPISSESSNYRSLVYIITVGGGGTGTSGTDSSISLNGIPLVNALGGGYNGGTGGSGGGGIAGGLATTNQGFGGGTGGASISELVPDPHWICPINPAHSKCSGWFPGQTTTHYYGGGGGGGAGSAGSANSSNNGGNGGNGIPSSITGSSIYRCGGGGGFYGNNGFVNGINGTNGLGTGSPNTGGGGGGGTAGNSGVVYLKIPKSVKPKSVTGNPNEINAGNYTVYEFTGSGSITF